ncbi:MAG: acyl-CoA dehydrogenase family protein [Bacteroidota bacterium]
MSDSLSRARQSFSEFLDRYRERMAHLFGTRADAGEIHIQGGLPPYVMARMREVDPLSVYIPKAYGGRGGRVPESLSMLEATGYHSLPLCLIVGINGGLFLQPVAKYGSEDLKRTAFDGFLREKKMGGLMITEPDYGSDALHMETAWTKTDEGMYHLEGTKHWAGLTGSADYWLLTARSRKSDGNLGRDVDLFVSDSNIPSQTVTVKNFYPTIGLRSIPYGLNHVDVRLPESSRLQPESTGIKMLLDTLHRSRLQFPGMGIGFLRRNFDDALAHCRERFVGGKALIDYDGVRARLAKIQAAVTGCAAMCLDSAEKAGIEHDLSVSSLKANAFKTVVTDWMQDTSHSFLQLAGGNGFRADHPAARGVVDSRPFQIFEGSNDILYQQVTESVVKAMRRIKATNLGEYLRTEPLTARAADMFGDSLSFDVDWKMPQRKLVELGRAISRIVSMEMTIELGERGYSADLIHNALDDMRAEVRSLLETYRRGGLVGLVEDASAPDWLARVKPSV